MGMVFRENGSPCGQDSLNTDTLDKLAGSISFKGQVPQN